MRYPALVGLREPTSLSGIPTGGDNATPGATIETRQISIHGQLLNVAIRHGDGSGPPLSLFNAIGANWELARPFLEALTGTTAFIFDVPDVVDRQDRYCPPGCRGWSGLRPNWLRVSTKGRSMLSACPGGIAQHFAHQ